MDRICVIDCIGSRLALEGHYWLSKLSLVLAVLVDAVHAEWTDDQLSKDYCDVSILYCRSYEIKVL